MKICVCGKGGCGKSSLISLLAFSFARSGKSVFILDSDESNNNLYRMLGFTAAPKAIMDYAGGKSRVNQKMRSRFTRGEDEPKMSVLTTPLTHPGLLPEEYQAANCGISLMVTGKIHHALEGCACAMGSVTREFVKNTQMNDNEILLIDTEAGIEHFGRGVEAGADGVIGIAEPSLESMELAKTIQELTLASGADFLGVIVNKTNSEQQKEIITAHLRKNNITILGYLPYNPELQNLCLSGAALSALGSITQIDAVRDKIQKARL